MRRFAGRRVLVVGDVMVDRYFWGRVSRISPEAPVPVVDVEKETRRLGGAANVAHNILSLGGTPLLCGCAGDDEDGRWLLEEMGRMGMESGGLLRSPDLPTTVKSRVVAHSQQVVRFDRERRGAPSGDLAAAMESFIRDRWGELDGVVVSDYAKGVVSERLMDRIRTLLRRRRLPVAVDPKSQSFRKYRSLSVITPNCSEALAAAALLGETSGDILKVGARLLTSSRCRALLVTRGEEGMTLFERGVPPHHIPAEAREVYDVTGAGDTVIGTLALALASGAPMRDAAAIANAAAGVVVGEFGTVPARADQVTERLEGSAR